MNMNYKCTSKYFGASKLLNISFFLYSQYASTSSLMGPRGDFIYELFVFKYNLIIYKPYKLFLNCLGLFQRE